MRTTISKRSTTLSYSGILRTDQPGYQCCAIPRLRPRIASWSLTPQRHDIHDMSLHRAAAEGRDPEQVRGGEDVMRRTHGRSTAPRGPREASPAPPGSRHRQERTHSASSSPSSSTDGACAAEVEDAFRSRPRSTWAKSAPSAWREHCGRECSCRARTGRCAHHLERHSLVAVAIPMPVRTPPGTRSTRKDDCSRERRAVKASAARFRPRRYGSLCTGESPRTMSR